MFGWAKYADAVCVVVEPTVKSLHTARRLLTLSDARWGPSRMLLVVNKARDPSDGARISERLGLEAAAVLPADPEAGRADRRGAAPLDAAPHGALAGAVGGLVDHVVSLYPLREEVVP